MVRSPRRLGALFVIAGGAALAAASPASAADTIVSVNFGTPTAEIATTVSARVVADTDGSLLIKTRATGGPACAPTAGTDAGETLASGSENDFAIGDTSRSWVRTFTKPGTYQWCAWLVTGSVNDPPRATATGTFTITGPQAAITGVSIGSVAVPNASFVVTVNGSSQASRNLYWRLRPGGEPPCAAAPALDTGTSSVANAAAVLGSFAVTITMSASRPGVHRLCTWVADSSGASSALTFNETLLTVPKPCTVPTLVGAKVGVARKRIERAGCRVGRVTYVGRPNRRADRVISAGRRSGAVLAPKTVVTLRVRR